MSTIVVPPVIGGSRRLIGHMHGQCAPPAYSCGQWAKGASERGFPVCPTADGRCGPTDPTAAWKESPARTDEDLEASIRVVEARFPGELDRQGAILTGYSIGAWRAPGIAASHPARWPHLILIESDVKLTVPMLRAAGVRSVALIGGQHSAAVLGMRRTASVLAHQGFPARFWVMPNTGHWFSGDIDQIMREALAFVIGEGDGEDAGKSPESIR